MTKKSETGKLGEDLACRYLVQNGYKVIERNHRQKWGEIDIIAKEKDGTLLLIEVKTATGSHPAIAGEDQMTTSKIHKFKKIAQSYATNYFKDRDDSKGFRLDLLTVNINLEDCHIKHYKNI